MVKKMVYVSFLIFRSNLYSGVQAKFGMKMDSFEKWLLTFKIPSEKSNNVFVQFQMKSQESNEIA